MPALGPYTCKQTCDAHLRSRLVCYDEFGGLQLNIFPVKSLTEMQKANSEIFHWCDLNGTQRDWDELRGVHWACLNAARIIGPISLDAWRENMSTLSDRKIGLASTQTGNFNMQVTFWSPS